MNKASGRIAAKKPLLKDIDKKKRLAWAKKHEQWILDRWTSVLSKFEIFGSNRSVFVRRRVDEPMISACVVPSVKHGEGGVMVWGCFAGDTVSDLFRGTLNQHGYHRIFQQYAILPGLCLVRLSFVFQQDIDPKHTRLCKGYLTWVSTITRPQPKLDGLGGVRPQREGKAANKCSAYVGTPSRLL